MSLGSFLSRVLHGVETGVAVASPILGPLASFVPGVGPIAATVLHAVVAAEQVAGSVQGTGAQKQAAVVSLVNAVHPGLDQAKLTSTIDGVVGALNALQAAFANLPKTVETTGSVQLPAPVAQ